MIETIRGVFDSFIAWGTAENALPYFISLLVVVGGGALMWARSQWATIPHELGHAFVALLLGRKLSGININKDSSGDTRTQEFKSTNPISNLITAPFRWIRGILVSFAGYPAPYVLGFALIYLWSHDYTRFASLLMFVLLAFTLLYSTNMFGFLLVITGLAITAISTWIDMPILRELFVLLIAGGMLSGGIKGTWEAWQVWRQDGKTSAERWGDPFFEPQHSDARALTQKTLIPQVIWLVLFSAVGIFVVMVSLVVLAQAYL